MLSMQYKRAVDELVGLLEAGLAKSKSEDGITLLHWAAYNNRIAIAKLFVRVRS